ncbi:DNA-binding MarR family transcriptional regulator [Rhizobium sp. BK196]|jgi:DNA-binding MarR family transcriptional regulator|uniref:MarR family winged helix-turn-helix transcriptional regulator n=1 Tax=unclassified Rhizobium TaxID=2613769 RepID=UPI001611B631|nr:MULTISPECIES: MarR family transcriptional regulator [unclassified Rhizobium]MBB3309525.1 DNA-binding MarR family transcriptional regulator [Rhizobium sp. BK196]MBB3465143.1 DNA-binding MarR family transcriptional regulator [Rhizobium sp. BK377]
MTNNPTLGFLLHDVARLLRKRFEQRAKDLGLTRSQWQTLAYLANNEGIHQSGLAEILEIEPITLVRILDKLAERGLIERRQHPTDRRIWLLYMREAAHPILAEMRKIGDVTRGEALESIAPEQREQLFHILSVMKTNLVQACRSPVAENETKHG